MTVGRMVEEEEEVEEEERGVSGQPGSSRATRRNPLSHPPPPPSNPSHPDDPANPLLRPPHPLPSLRPIQTSAHFSTFASFSLPAGGGWWSPIQRSFHAHTANGASPSPVRTVGRDLSPVFTPSFSSCFLPLPFSFSAVVSADLFRADRSFVGSY